jgi:DNA-binding response OmpR family regulator
VAVMEESRAAAGAAGESEAAEATGHAAGNVPERTLTILVVEDDAALAELLRAALAAVPGWRVAVAPDAAVALALCAQGRVDVVVTDVHLPGLSGPELLGRLADALPGGAPPALLLSSDGDPPGVREALATGAAVGFLRKPFDLDELLARIAAAGWGRRPRAPPRSGSTAAAIMRS